MTLEQYWEQRRWEGRAVPRVQNLAHSGGLRADHPMAARQLARFGVSESERVPFSESAPVHAETFLRECDPVQRSRWRRILGHWFVVEAIPVVIIFALLGLLMWLAP